MRTYRRRTGSAALAACALVLAACAAPSDAEGMRPMRGPLDEMSALIHGFAATMNETHAEREARFAAQRRAEEEITAACMAELGFHYLPVEDDGSTFVFINLDEELGIPTDPREFAARYGLGISNNPWTFEGMSAEELDAHYDPNAAQVEAMSETERDAWFLALHGDPATQDGGEDFDWLQHGCAGYARAQFSGGPDLGDDDQFAALHDEMNRHWERLPTDPRAMALAAEWVACMADAGHHGFARRGGGEGSLSWSMWQEWDRLQGVGPELQAMLEHWDWAANPDGPPGLFATPEDVADFTQREFALAIADAECRVDLDYDARLTEIDHAIQQEFVDRHRVELEAWAAHNAERRRALG